MDARNKRVAAARPSESATDVIRTGPDVPLLLQPYPYPRLVSARLLLREFRERDAPELARLANNPYIAYYTEHVPHPYGLEDAYRWIARHAKHFAAEQSVVWAVIDLLKDRFVGTCGLSLNTGERAATLGYWIGQPFWCQGYATEAALTAAKWAYDTGFERLQARCMARNTASATVLRRLALRQEGVLRGCVMRDGVRCDMLWFGALRGEWRTARA